MKEIIKSVLKGARAFTWIETDSCFILTVPKLPEIKIPENWFRLNNGVIEEDDKVWDKKSFVGAGSLKGKIVSIFECAIRQHHTGSEVPHGWEQVTEGRTEINDRYYHSGKHYYIGIDNRDVGQVVELYGKVIRRKA